MHTTTLEAGRYNLTDAGALHLLGEIVASGDPSMVAIRVAGEVYESPRITDLYTDETDIMYGRIVDTPAGPVRVEDDMAIVAYDQPTCENTHPQSAFWGTLELEEDTELSWGPGWYQLAGRQRVDLLAPQATAVTTFDVDVDPYAIAEPLTRDEIEAMGFHRSNFHNSYSRYAGPVDDLVAKAEGLGLDGLVAKLGRLRDAGAETITEILQVQLRPSGDEAQAVAGLENVGMTAGAAMLMGIVPFGMAA